MFSLQAFRQARTLIRWVLVWFALTLGLAVATPLVQPQSLSLVCTTAGAVKLVASGDQGSAPTMSHTALDCVLCLATGAPLNVTAGTLPVTMGVGTVPTSKPATRTAWLTAAPPPGRGPPSLV